jgi:transcriptional regulator with XRE-family HTH domain
MIDEASIGRRIRTIRRAKSCTLQSLADATGLTKGYISKIENSGRAAPVATLLKIARALEVSPSELFGEVDPQGQISVIRQNDRVTIARGPSEFGYEYESLCTGIAQKYMQAYFLTTPPRTTCAVTSHDGEELLFILRGKMIMHYGDQQQVLDEGDSVYFDASVPHFGEVAGDEPVEAIMVTSSASAR